MLKRLLLSGLLLFSASGVHAGILVEFTGATGTDWHYTVSMTPALFLQNGGDNFFSVYDFKGLQDVTWTPVVGAASDWTVTKSLTSPPPSLINPSDDPTLLNATVTYQGAVNFDPGSDTVTLGELTLKGLLAGPATLAECGAECGSVDFGANTFQPRLPPKDPTLFGNFSDTKGPSAVPEPGTLGMLVAGLLAAGAFVRRRARR